jgi:hypothetical protein
VKKSSPSEWHNIFEKCRENVIDIERSIRLQSHKSSENVKNVRNILVDSEFDLPKGEVRIHFTFISGQTNFKRNLMQKTILE